MGDLDSLDVGWRKVCRSRDLFLKVVINTVDEILLHQVTSQPFLL